jgi:hypothetical protein
MAPNRTLANVSVSGTKESKERMSIGVCCNASGNDKLKLLLISKVKRPRCFGKVFDPNNIVHYYNNEKAWMTTIIFEDWLKKWNAKLKLQNRCILLLVDNASSHNTDLTFSNIRIHFLPPNTTSILQPCDAGIIRSFKCHYKNKLVQQMLKNIENKMELYTPSLKDAIFLCRDSWSCVTGETIKNCWLHVQILSISTPTPFLRVNFERKEAICQDLKDKIEKFHKQVIKI